MRHNKNGGEHPRSGFAAMNREGVLKNANAWCREMLDLPPDSGELASAPASNPLAREVLDKLARLEPQEELSFDLACKGRRLEACLTATGRDAEDIVLLIHDVTDRTTREDSLRVALRRQMRVSETMTDRDRRFCEIGKLAHEWFWEMDDRLRFTYFSSHIEKFTKAPMTQILGQTRHQLGADTEDPKWQQHLDDLHNRRPFRDFRYAFICPGAGDVRHWVISGDPQFDENGNFTGYHGIGRDETDIMQRERELEALSEELRLEKERAEAANRAKSDFLATVSHELRTPLNGVLGMTEFLLQTELSREQRRYVGIIQQSGDSLLTVLNDILDFSKIESGKVELDPVDTDLIGVAESVVELFSVRAHEKGLQLAVSTDGDLPPGIVVDDKRLRQILINLVANAVKFTSKGGVHLQVTGLERCNGRARVRLAVTDTGIGIPQAKISTLFQRFSQVDSSTTRRYGGTGLGLAISNQLAGLMGSRILVDSAQGAGSTFAFDLDVPETNAVPASARELDKVSLQGFRVLCVDDSEVNRIVFARQLMAFGVDVEVVEDASAAMTALRRAHDEGRAFDLAILDHMMPEVDGVMLCQMIRADTALAGIKVALSSCQGPLAPQREYPESGFDALVSKPLRPRELKLRLAELLLESGPTQPETHSNSTTECSLEQRDGGAPSEGGTVLVAEDNEVNQLFAELTLSAAGHRVVIAADGVAAVEETRAMHFDLILMDMQMPEMDGLEATRAIRSRGGWWARVPIVAMTANALEVDRKRCFDAGMDDFISKPIKQHELASKMDHWLGRTREGAPSKAQRVA